MQSTETRSAPKLPTQMRYDFAVYDLSRPIRHFLQDYLKISQGDWKLSELHSHIKATPIFELYHALYRFFESPDFKSSYLDFIEKNIAPILPPGYLVQTKPGIRIHLPKGKTVQYHTDEWYGHGPTVVNFWMPLTRAYDSNALFLASLEDSIALEEKLRNDRATMEEMNDALEKCSVAMNTVPGDILVFNSKTAHGTQDNETGETRLSLDFRAVHRDDSTGTKERWEYYYDPRASRREQEKLAAAAPAQGGDCAVYFYPSHGFSKHIRAHYQRLICNEYARKLNMRVIGEETEIHTMQYHPLLRDLARGKGVSRFDHVIAFSVLTLPEDIRDRRAIYEASQESGVNVIFANEQVSLQTHSVDEIESLRNQLSAN